MDCIPLTWPPNQSRTCVLCVDNEDAVAALVKGSSTSPLGSLPASLFWSIAARGSTLWWVEWVGNKSKHRGHTITEVIHALNQLRAQELQAMRHLNPHQRSSHSIHSTGRPPARVRKLKEWQKFDYFPYD